MLVQQVADRVDVRHSGNQIQHACAEGDFGRGAYVEDVTSGAQHGRYERTAQERKPYVVLMFQHDLFEPESRHCGDEHYKHRHEVAAEQLAERGIGEAGEDQHFLPSGGSGFADFIETSDGGVQVKMVVGHFPAEAAEACVKIEADAAGGSLAHGRHGIAGIAAPYRNGQMCGQDEDVELNIEGPSHPARVFLDTYAGGPASRQQCGIFRQKRGDAAQVIVRTGVGLGVGVGDDLGDGFGLGGGTVTD